jgi:hypothetical protein
MWRHPEWKSGYERVYDVDFNQITVLENLGKASGGN